jgi:hypothetical protein
MDFKTHQYRKGLELLENSRELGPIWEDFKAAIQEITDEEIESHFLKNGEGSKKSISPTLNHLLKVHLKERGFKAESSIFANDEFNYSIGTTKTGKVRKTKLGVWRLDFSKQVEVSGGQGKYIGVAVEVSFNHGEAIAWNLIKPVIASELNWLEKETDIGEGVGIIICATRELKVAGGFDPVVGDFDKILTYLDALRTQLSIPLVIVGLHAPESFHIKWEQAGNKKLGKIARGPVVLD